jgi:hypothetical protein
MNYILLAGLVTSLIISSVFAEGTYQEPEDFLNQAFTGDVPEVKKFWIPKELQQDRHKLRALRVSYWQRDKRTVWILEEIGKSLPITVGIIINENKIERINVLIFRESRGWEIRYPFFTDQFNDAMLTQENQLDIGIDGISGATLSVNALKNLAALALLFHHQIVK